MKKLYLLLTAVFILSCQTPQPITDTNKQSLTPIPQPQESSPPTISVSPSFNPPKIKAPEIPKETIPTTFKQKTPTGHKKHTFESMIIELRKTVAKNPQNKNAKLKLAALYILNENFAEAEKILAQINNPKDDFVVLLKAYVLEKLGVHQDAEQLLQSVLDRWLSKSGIKITNIVLCETIINTGNYKPHPTCELAPGEPARVHITVSGFKMQKLLKSWEMFLRYNWELFNSRGEKIVIKRWQNASERDKTDRIKFSEKKREFSQYFRLPMPRNLPMGKYKIRVTVEDIFTGKKSYGEVELQILEDFGN
jgi:tetratricopeptide (TPR) repeat protein